MTLPASHSRVAEPPRKLYRRKGYRVVIETQLRCGLRWAVIRPRMHTPAKTGHGSTMEAAIAGANAWIAIDEHGLRVT